MFSRFVHCLEFSDIHFCMDSCGVFFDFSKLISSQGFPIGNPGEVRGGSAECVGHTDTLLFVGFCFCTPLTMLLRLFCRNISVFLPESLLTRTVVNTDVFLRCPFKCNEVVLFRKKYLCFQIRCGFESHFRDCI